MSLDKQEVLEKLREKYQRAVEKYGEQYFSLLDLETRITHLVKNKASVETFMQQEIEFYESLKARAEAAEEEANKRAEFNERLDKMMQENEAKIAKYPDVFFDPNASKEIRHFTGAVTSFVDTYGLILRKQLGGALNGRDLFNILGEIERFYLKDGQPPTMLLKHYVEELIVRGESAREEFDRKLLQTGGLLLYRISRAVSVIINDFSAAVLERLVELPSSLPLEIKDRFKSLSLQEFCDQAVHEINSILTDFRINDLVEHAYRSLP